MPPNVVTLEISRAAYTAKGLGWGPGEHSEISADFGGGDRRYRLLSAVVRPQEPAVIEATFQEMPVDR